MCETKYRRPDGREEPLALVGPLLNGKSVREIRHRKRHVCSVEWLLDLTHWFVYLRGACIYLSYFLIVLHVSRGNLTFLDRRQRHTEAAKPLK